ncbi:MAG: hypothetical protein EXR57_00205 [Dehalococcoidia bacterium]|nr:hypothetical protein [Dehalococcoidia bacterium]MSQ34226.1 hypothetical protein [Dehalococcoidia bacterium]
MLYPLRQSAIEFEVDGEPVQGVLATPVDGAPPYPGVLICHAHPLFGGNMDSPVTFAICKALAEHNVATLRFNFRPFREGATEAGGSAARDVAGALDTLRAWREVKPRQCGVVGYSAGAAAMARGMNGLKDAKAFALISPPLSSIKGSPLSHDKRPRLFIVGSRDKIVAPAELAALVEEMRPPVEIAQIEGPGHDMRGAEQEVAARVAMFFGQILRN